LLARCVKELNGDTLDPTCISLDTVTELERSSLVDVGLWLLHDQPVTGHVESRSGALR